MLSRINRDVSPTDILSTDHCSKRANIRNGSRKQLSEGLSHLDDWNQGN